jgi:hypothetical protein
MPLNEAQTRFSGLADGSDDESPGSDPGEFFLILPGERKPSDQREESGPPMADADQESPAGLIDGENEESLPPIEWISSLSFILHQWTIHNRCYLQEQDGAC